MSMFHVAEVCEGECVGKFVVQNMLGGFLNDDGNVRFFDTVAEADVAMARVESDLLDMVSSLPDLPDMLDKL